VTVLAIAKASVIEYGRTPGVGGVAGSAVHAEPIEMNVRLSVTGDTLLRGVLKDIVYVALVARHLDVGAGELESGQVVVKGGLLPTIGHVAPGTVLSQPSVVKVVLLVARLARRVYLLVAYLGVAVGAGQRHVRPGRGKICMSLMALFAGCRITSQGHCPFSGGVGRLAVAFSTLYALFRVDGVAHLQIAVGYT
jgi:hypothetical protein